MRMSIIIRTFALSKRKTMHETISGYKIISKISREVHLNSPVRNYRFAPNGVVVWVTSIRSGIHTLNGNTSFFYDLIVNIDDVEFKLHDIDGTVDDYYNHIGHLSPTQICSTLRTFGINGSRYAKHPEFNDFCDAYKINKRNSLDVDYYNHCRQMSKAFGRIFGGDWSKIDELIREI